MTCETTICTGLTLEARYHVIHAPTGRRLTLHVMRGRKHRRFALRDGTPLMRVARWIYEDGHGDRYGAISDKAP